MPSRRGLQEADDDDRVVAMPLLSSNSRLTSRGSATRLSSQGSKSEFKPQDVQPRQNQAFPMSTAAPTPPRKSAAVAKMDAILADTPANKKKKKKSSKDADAKAQAQIDAMLSGSGESMNLQDLMKRKDSSNISSSSLLSGSNSASVGSSSRSSKPKVAAPILKKKTRRSKPDETDAKTSDSTQTNTTASSNSTTTTRRDVNWSNEVYVFDPFDIRKNRSDNEISFNPTSRHKPQDSSSRQESKQGERSMGVKKSSLRRSMTSSGESRKSFRIDNREKRETRWQMTRLLVANSLRSHKKVMAEKDDLLPDTDEFDAFATDNDNDDDNDEDHFVEVREAMLENPRLSEREVAAFLEGCKFFNVKVRSLQSQLASEKLIHKEQQEREHRRRKMIRSRSMAARRTDPLVTEDGGPVSGSLKLPSIPSMVLESPPEPRRKSSKSSLSSSTADLSTADSSSSTASVDSTKKKKKSKKKSKSESSSSSSSSTKSRPQTLRQMSIMQIQKDHQGNDEVARLLKELEEAEKKQKKLEKQLQSAGIVIAEDIPYEVCKEKVEEIAKRMNEIGSSEVTHPDKEVQTRLREEYFKLEQDMEKYSAALMLTDEYILIQEEKEQKWEDDNAEENESALRKLRRHMPVNVKSLTEAQLCTDPTPNGNFLSRAMARKFKRTNVLQLLRINPQDIVRMHPSTLENMRVVGMTLTERRAMYAHLKDVGPKWKAMQADQMTERKWTWYKMMKQNFKENLTAYQRHVAQYGPPGNHPYATRDNPNGCPLIGKQCPLKADKVLDYDGDYGFPEGAEYEVSNVKKTDKEDPGAKAMREAAELAREKKASERSDALKNITRARYSSKYPLPTEAASPWTKAWTEWSFCRPSGSRQGSPPAVTLPTISGAKSWKALAMPSKNSSCRCCNLPSGRACNSRGKRMSTPVNRTFVARLNWVSVKTFVRRLKISLTAFWTA